MLMERFCQLWYNDCDTQGIMPILTKPDLLLMNITKKAEEK
jgi:hypothetical protein